MLPRRKISSPLLLRYKEALDKNPHSKVFAPLAESYRKLGMIDEAMEILKQGLKKHPHYTLGHLSLGACYFDKEKFDLCYKILLPLVSLNLENILLQKLFAQAALKLGHWEEALEVY